MKDAALVYTLADRLVKVDAETQGHALFEVKANSLVDDLTDWPTKLELETLSKD